MKKGFICSILSIVLSATVCIAQPIISTLTAMPLGTKTIAYPIPGTIVEGSAGAAQTWNYAAIPHDTAAYYFQSVAYAGLSQALKDTFPTGNLANDLFMGGNFVATLVFRHDANVLEYLGLNTTKFATPDTQLVFPFQYQETHAGFTYDAYGTLITPFGTFNNVVRLREVVGSNFKYDYWQFAPVYRLVMEYKVDTVTQVMTEKAFFNTDLVASVKELAENAAFQIFPNPASGTIYLQTELSGDAEVSIVDVLGKVCLQQSLKVKSGNPMKLDLSGMKSGIYLLNFALGSTNHSRMVMVQ